MNQRVVRHQPAEKHLCEGRREGDWIVYACAECDYQMRNNVLTGETRTLNASQDVAHSGWYVPLH